MRRMAARLRRLVLQAGVLAAALLLISGCVGATPTGAPASPLATLAAAGTPSGPPSTPDATARPTSVAPEARLQENLVLADGRRIAARCIGVGTPTILLEVGGSGDMGDWDNQFVRLLGAGTTTCLYSRAGGRGSSAPPESPRTMAGVTSDAFEVLELAEAKADIQGPYIFVGWSLGGSVALANALARPDQTVGVAILDTDFPSDFMAACAADGRAVDDCQAEFDLDIEAKFMETEIARAVQPLDIPAKLVTAMLRPDCANRPSATLSVNVAGTTVVGANCTELAAAVADKQIDDWKTALPEIEQTRAQANHDELTFTAGAEIAELILELVEEARASG
jgi:pimeloyl-ACP methyl ester carboxylesterase